MKEPGGKANGERVRRISVSLPEDVYHGLGRIVSERGFESRSQAIAEMIGHQLAEHQQRLGNEIMAGTLTLVYDESKSTLLRDLARIERENLNEVISSQHVLLEENHVLEVILMQGPARTLRKICNQLVSCKGVKIGKLTLTPILLPPIHQKTGDVLPASLSSNAEL